MDLTILTDHARTVAGDLADNRAWIATGDLGAALGWELKPEGLCRGDVCVPVRDRDGIVDGDRADLVRVADALDRPVVIDPEAAIVALGAPRHDRRRLLADREAPEFTLPDLDDTERSLGEWGNRKRLLVAFASW